MIQVFPFLGRKVVHLHEIQRLGHAEFDAIRITVAEVAFPHSTSSHVPKDIAERTGLQAHPAPHALERIHDDGMGLVVTPDGRTGTDSETIRCFTLRTDQCGDEPLPGIDIDTDVCLLAFKIACLDKGTGIFTVSTPYTTVQISRDHLHRQTP